MVSSQTCSDDKIGKGIFISGATPGPTSIHDSVNVILAPPSGLTTPLFTASAPNVALHFNPRLSAIYNTVVRNAFLNGNWGAEETGGGMPFTPNSAYTLAIIMQEDKFKISVNGAQFTTFAYRIRPSAPMTVLVSPGLFGSVTEVKVV